MKTSIKVAIITGICGIIAGGVGGGYLVSSINSNQNVNKNINNNTLIFTNESGEKEEITVDDFQKIQKDNKELKEDLEESKKKLLESIEKNKEKSDALKSNSEKILDVLYDGKEYRMYKASDGGNGIKIGGKSYTDAFTIGGYGGFVLLNLDKKFSHMNFEVGRVDESRISDADVRIYLDNNLSGEYEINSQIPLTALEADLAGATTLKIELTSDDYVEYGFINLELQ